MCGREQLVARWFAKRVAALLRNLLRAIGHPDSVTTPDSRTIMVGPPRRSDGVALMLVALGDAGIGVSQVAPDADETGHYFLTVDRDPQLAVRILEGIGCDVQDRPQAESRTMSGGQPDNLSSLSPSSA